MANQNHRSAADRLAEIGREKYLKDRIERQQGSSESLGVLIAASYLELEKSGPTTETTKPGPDGTLTREQSELLEQLQIEPGSFWGHYGEPDNF